MGLDFSHGNVHFSYSGFMFFRRALAKTINIDLDEMEGFENFGSVEKGKSWDSVDSKLKPLLNHSDCGGILTVDECKEVIQGLKEVILKLDELNQIKCKELILTIEEAIEANEPLEFC